MAVLLLSWLRVETHYFREPRRSQSLARQEKGEERIGNTVELFGCSLIIV
ncbi:MAG TPA: hypothetical protein VIH63_13480 [Xanthobacteraceae bacterium]